MLASTMRQRFDYGKSSISVKRNYIAPPNQKGAFGHTMPTLIQALRCIGQNLEQFPVVKDVEIETSEGKYLVRVTVKWPFRGKTPEVAESRVSAGPSNGACDADANRSFQLHYTDKDIQY